MKKCISCDFEYDHPAFPWVILNMARKQFLCGECQALVVFQLEARGALNQGTYDRLLRGTVQKQPQRA